MVLKIKRLEKNGLKKSDMPKKATASSAGFDLQASIEAPITIKPGELVKIPTGISLEIPQGHCGLVFGRSGLGIKNGIHPSNAVGVIDSDYRGEIAVGLCNVSDREYTVAPFERIAQLVIMKLPEIEITEADELGGTERGSSGFGSSGKF